MEKLASLRRRFIQEGLLVGSTAGHFTVPEDSSDLDNDIKMDVDGLEDNGGEETPGVDPDDQMADVGPESGPRSLSSIRFAATHGIVTLILF